MTYIRKATKEDLNRIGEIEIFNYRLYFYPIFQSDEYYFSELQVPTRSKQYEDELENLYVYDDGVVKGFMCIHDDELKKLFVEPILQNQTIGSQLLTYALKENKITYLWALEKNTRAIAFYEAHGFHLTNNRKLEEGTDEYLVKMERAV